MLWVAQRRPQNSDAALGCRQGGVAKPHWVAAAASRPEAFQTRVLPACRRGGSASESQGAQTRHRTRGAHGQQILSAAFVSLALPNMRHSSLPAFASIFVATLRRLLQQPPSSLAEHQRAFCFPQENRTPDRNQKREKKWVKQGLTTHNSSPSLSHAHLSGSSV